MFSVKCSESRDMKSNKRVVGGEGGGAEVSLDSQGCLSLQQVLDAFNAPISEEHAWALFYQGAVALRRGFSKAQAQGAAPARAPRLPAHFYLYRDGTVHSRTLFPEVICDKDDDETDSTPLSEHKMVVNLAMIVYRALDFAQPEDEERLVSPDLENLITDMTADDEMNDSESNKGSDDTGPEVGGLGGGHGGAGGAPETDDEGIERDSGDVMDYMPRHFFTLERVIERCSRHAGRTGAAAHYQAVCRALVVEALELAQFLAKVKDGGARDLVRRADAATSCRELESLRFSDWARFWMQVIGELRMGVKLKKVSFSRTPIEYEMTPYEILMDDIRSRRFNLRKVDGVIPPRVKKDAHAMILEFIRSRPPLKKASERKLPPREARPPTPREQLLDSIKRGLPLKPMHKETPSAPSPAWRRPREEEPGGPSARPARRLIKVDFEDFGPLDDDDDDEVEEVAAAPKVLATPPQPLPRSFAKGALAKTSTPKPPSPKPWRRTASPPLPPRAPPRTHITHHEYHQFCDSALESYDLATQCPSRRASMRRHTIVACSNPADSMGGSGSHSVPQSRPDSRQSGISVTSSDVDNLPLGTLGGTPNDISWSRNSLQEELIQSVSAPCKKQWQEAMSLDERLSLTLEEIVHIRSVLTKAELEALPVEGRVKEDVEKRKVCFLCLKTRFGIFGPWGQRCKLCKKTVCAKCFSKMRIPTEHFSNVPVVLLSPSLMPSPEDDVHTSFPRSLMARLISPEQNHDRSDNSVGSAPSSPSLQRSQTSSMARSLEGTLNTSSPSHPPSSYVQSAPGSRGGSSLGYVPDQMQTLPPAASIMTRSMEGPQSLPVTNGSPHHTLDRRNRFYRGNTLAGGVRASDRLRGVQMIVCHDCKTMVLQIIKSSRTSRSATRNHTIRNLTLNLSPVYNN